MITMTPKEKAKQLIDKFVSLDNDIFCSVSYPYSKQCALILVDELINTGYNELEYYGILSSTEYWQEVKQEIEKL